MLETGICNDLIIIRVSCYLASPLQPSTNNKRFDLYVSTLPVPLHGSLGMRLQNTARSTHVRYAGPIRRTP